MATTKSILNSCAKAYEKSGVQGAIDKAAKLSVKVMRFCSPCDAEQPSVAKYCCVCGHKNK